MAFVFCTLCPTSAFSDEVFGGGWPGGDKKTKDDKKDDKKDDGKDDKKEDRTTDTQEEQTTTTLFGEAKYENFEKREASEKLEQLNLPEKLE